MEDLMKKLLFLSIMLCAQGSFLSVQAGNEPLVKEGGKIDINDETYTVHYNNKRTGKDGSSSHSFFATAPYIAKPLSWWDRCKNLIYRKEVSVYTKQQANENFAMNDFEKNVSTNVKPIPKFLSVSTIIAGLCYLGYKLSNGN
jgi:hypothetical protein